MKEYDPKFVALLRKLVMQSAQEIFAERMEQHFIEGDAALGGLMAGPASIKFEYRFVDAEADGSRCLDCKEQVWFKGRAREMREMNVSPRRKELGRGQWERLFILCSSCADCHENALEEA